jgi:hypothetical protein
MRNVWAVCLSLGAAVPAFGQQIYITDADSLGLIEFSEIAVHNLVEDGCWSSAAAIEARVRQLFTQSDLRVIDYKAAFYGYDVVLSEITALGLRTPAGLCAVNAEFRVVTRSFTPVGTSFFNDSYTAVGMVELFSSNTLLTGDDDMDDRLYQFFIGAAGEFLSKRYAARGADSVIAFRTDNPSDGTPPMSYTEYQSIAESEKPSR